MIERVAEVVGVREGQLRLRSQAGACEGCSSGCGGRCRLFPLNDDGLIDLPLPATSVDAGEYVRLCVDAATLRRYAWRGYGLALLGLLAGALLATGLADRLLPESLRDVATLIGALLGTLLAARLSNRHASPVAVHRLPSAGTASPSSDPSPSESA